MADESSQRRVLSAVARVAVASTRRAACRRTLRIGVTLLGITFAAWLAGAVDADRPARADQLTVPVSQPDQVLAAVDDALASAEPAGVLAPARLLPAEAAPEVAPEVARLSGAPAGDNRRRREREPSGYSMRASAAPGKSRLSVGGLLEAALPGSLSERVRIDGVPAGGTRTSAGPAERAVTIGMFSTAMPAKGVPAAALPGAEESPARSVAAAVPVTVPQVPGRSWASTPAGRDASLVPASRSGPAHTLSSRPLPAQRSLASSAAWPGISPAAAASPTRHAGALAGSDAVRALTRDLLRRASTHQNPLLPAPPAPDSPAGDGGMLPSPSGGLSVPGAGYIDRHRTAVPLVVTPSYGWAADRPPARIVTDEPSFSPD